MASSDPAGLHRLVYVSSASGVLPAHQLDRILLRSRACNASIGVTGLLVFQEGNFLQCLEGPEARVAALMTRIRRDRRHVDLDILESGPCSARVFPDWPMGYVAPRNLSVGRRARFADLLAVTRERPPTRPAPHAAIGDRVWSLLSSFREAAAI